MSKRIIVIDGKQLSDNEVKILDELVTSGFDSMCEDFDDNDETKYRSFTDKFFPN
jgi:hypothetical protein